LGATHEQFGAALCKLWKFPASFGYVTGYHHRPLDLPEDSRTLAALVHVADITAANCKLGYARSVESATVGADVLAATGLTQADVDEAAGKLPEAIESVSAMLTDVV
jgi:HD-like signal output (HDOD) protein